MAAPTPLLDATGRPVALAPRPIATGGEGAIFDVVGDPASVAKVYLRPPTPEHAEKLRVMAQLAAPALLQVAAWPTATLHPEPGGPIAGILMPKVAGREIHHLYSVAQRKKDFPEADWRFLIHAARNCAIAFEAIHAAGHVVGDVNQKNVLVSSRAIVQFVDCDSFQVRGPTGKLYRCEVGVPEFTPPELQGQSFRAVDRTPGHDRFGLAVLVFHLLMMGRHPFSGIYSGAGEMPLETAIQTRRFAYSKTPALTEMRPPPNTPPVAILDGGLGPLFERAFVGAGGDLRPSPTEWNDALTALLGQLGSCPVDPRHVFPRALGACPWCQLIGSAGVLFFLPGSTIAGQPTRDFQFAVVWAEVERWTAAEFEFIRPAPSRPTRPRRVPRSLGVPSPVPPPSEPAGLDGSFEVFAALGLVASLVLLCCARTVALVGLVLFSGWLVGLIATVPRRLARAERRNQARDRSLQEHWESENRDWVTEFRRRIARRDEALAALSKLEEPHQEAANAALAGFNAVRGPLEATKVRYERETRDYQSKRQAIVKNSRQLQRNQWLDSVLIADHRIAGISSARLSNLRSFGIETALDVEKLSQVKVPQIGPKLTERLVAWRDAQVENFQFDAGLPSRELVTLERNHRALIDQWEATLTAGPERLRDLMTRFRPRKVAAIGSIQVAVDLLHQAELDVAIMERMLT